MTERVQLALLRFGGFVAASAALVLTVRYGGAQPMLFGAISSLIAWYVGKATGEPITAVTIHALQSMHPAKALEQVRKVALESAPDRAEEVVEHFARALYSMSPPPPPPAAPVVLFDVDDKTP